MAVFLACIGMVIPGAASAQSTSVAAVAPTPAGNHQEENLFPARIPAAKRDSNSGAPNDIANSARARTQDTSIHWKGVLRESGMFLAIQHVYLAQADKKWVLSDNGVPFNHYWRDYMTSLHTWANSGWNDGDSFRDNNIAHPLQGALYGYMLIHNDPSGRALEFENSRRYWFSRLKAMGWAAAMSTQWEIGPISEMTVEKYGYWAPASGWMHHGKRVNGEGQTDLVMTPVAGFGWMLMEDLLDRHVARAVEARTRNAFLIAFTRCLLNPARGAENILHGDLPWHRDSRTAAAVYAERHLRPAPKVADAGR